jgi:hypothetical protein
MAYHAQDEPSNRPRPTTMSHGTARPRRAQMPIDTTARPPQTAAYRLFELFQRIVAVLCLVAGLKYWALLSGVHGGELWRFDLMPVYWQVAATSLAVLLPVAAVGLWMPNSWGPVIWFVAAVGEAVMYLGFPELFGRQPVTVMTHGLTALVYVAFRLVLYREKRKSRQPVRVDSL